MKIIAIAPLASSSAGQILALIKTLDANLIILPGHCANTPSAARVRRALPQGTFVFLEAGEKQQASPYLISSSAIAKLPKQVFGTSPTKQDLLDLESCFPHRTVRVGKHWVSFILCGEINAFQADGSAKFGIELPFDILINPAHSVMGRWHILGKKLSALSHQGVVVHTANNLRDSSRLTTDVRIYAGGRQVGERDGNEFAAWCAYEIPSSNQ